MLRICTSIKFVLTAYHSSNHHKNSRVWKGFMIFLKAHFIGEFECHLIRYVACKMVHNPFCPLATDGHKADSRDGGATEPKVTPFQGKFHDP